MLTVRLHQRTRHFIDELIRHQVEHPATAVSLAEMFAAANPDGARMDFPRLNDEILPLMSTSDTMVVAL
jgi:hypothetical protein